MLFARRGGLNAVLVLFASTIAFLTEANAEPVCGKADLSKLKTRIYVAPGGSDGTDCGGTVASACASIQYGIGRCTVSGCGVLVRYGLYQTTATITLRDGVGVYGSCIFDTRADPRYRTVVQANPATGTPAISAHSINTATTVYGLVVTGRNETQPGTASVAMTVSNSSGLALRTTVLVSGQGGPGTDGANASAVGPGGAGTASDPAQPQWPGVGGRSCAAHPSDAGNGASGSWQQRIVQLGIHGQVVCLNTGQHSGGSSGSVPGGAGGTIGHDGLYCAESQFNYPGNGGNAQPGGAGQAGAQAIASPSIAGMIAATQWQPSMGGNGAAGAVGSGGGGGGAGGTCTWFWGNGAYWGFAGAAGGGGGCGGAPGTGGQQGGASIALLLSNSQVDLSDHSQRIIAGVGGRGGTGGSSVAGGAGGNGGGGVHSGQWLFWGHYCPGLSGDGGAGGPGGAGSGAAGGNGGPSIAIALAGSSPTPPSDSGIYSGLPGNGGSRGRGGPAITANGITSPAGPDGQDGLTGAAAAWIKY